ncbi:MAG: class I SAM-dependent methyltransferase [Candidatus Bathyarchaeota archaeon]|nr:class I SAM-dependent methyltransferase [Candidatus Bathyarchaeota archaeon]
MRPKVSKDYAQTNKRHWNAIAQRERTNKMDMLRLIRNDVSSYFEMWEPKLAPYLKNVKGKRIIVPQFGDGLVMLACAKKGAIVTGVDFSSEQIRFAKESAKYCGVEVNLVEAEWQNLPKSIPINHFDLAVTECGIFIWIADLDAWMRNAFRVLKKYGKLIVSDFHPLSIITEEMDGKVTFRRSYFDQSPEICKAEEGIPPSVEFRWKLSDIINAAIRAGFRIECVEEYYVEQENKRVPILPTNFLLVATKR